MRNPAQRERRAAYRAVSESSDGSPRSDRHRAIVNRFDDSKLVLEIPRTVLAVNIAASPIESSASAFAERTRVQQLEAGFDGVGNRNELLIDLTGRDLLKQLPLLRHELPVMAGRPQQRMIMFQSSRCRDHPQLHGRQVAIAIFRPDL